MIRIFKKLTGNHLLMFSLIFIASTVFCSYKIGFSDLWSDETYTKPMLSGSPGDFYAMFRNDLHPPLYYTGLTHCWLKAEMSNVDAFPEILQYTAPDEFLEPGEKFLVARFHNLDLNQANMDLGLSESELITTDTVFDRKVTDGIFLQLYLLKYKGVQVE